MRQIDIYKEAHRQLSEAVPDSIAFDGFDMWQGPDHKFTGLCALVHRIAQVGGGGVHYLYGVLTRFAEDSEKILGRELHEEIFWFTEIEVDEPKARAERLEHLEKLIKLYEDDTSRDI